MLKDNNIHWFTTGNKNIKSAIAKCFNQTTQHKIMKCMHENKTNRYIDVLPKLIKNYSNSYHRSIKMRLVKKKMNLKLIKNYVKKRYL